ncbi:hypothetical protein K9L16_04105 [Candidatus Pacearchaeota archaeon]|nr:hypothetical protein [Candidatus Pacearchaeota archaeon]
MISPEEYRKKPIYKTDFSKSVPVLIEDIRNNLTKLRGIIRGYPNYKDRLNHIQDLLTCGLSCLYSEKQNIINIEIKQNDYKYGKSISFRSCGIGIDNCSCFICGDGNERMMNNILAFVKSKSDGEEAISWFDKGAYLDYRSHEPNWVQVKIGACEQHLPALEKLNKLIFEQYDVLRKRTIKKAKMY